MLVRSNRRWLPTPITARQQAPIQFKRFLEVTRTASTQSKASTGSTTNECVKWRWKRRKFSEPPSALTTSTSGTFAARNRIQAARGVKRSRPARASMIPVSECVRLSTRQLIRHLGVAHVRDGGVSIHRQSASRPFSVETGSVESEARHVDDVALIRNDDTLTFDRVTDLTQHDQP